MAKAGYTATTTTANALTANTPKTILTVVAPAGFGIDLRGFELSLDGASSTGVPCLWELCTHTAATAGTSTAVTAAQEYGRTIASGVTAANNFTVEPTILAALYADTIPVFNGLVIRDFPFNGGPDSAVSQGFALRLTTPAGSAAVNARATFRFERC